MIFSRFPMVAIADCSGGAGFSSLFLVTAARSARERERVEGSCVRVRAPCGQSDPDFFCLPATACSVLDGTITHRF